MNRNFILLPLFFLVSITVTWSQKTLWIKNSIQTDNGFTVARRMVLHPNGSIYVLGQMKGTILFDGEKIINDPDTILNNFFIARYSKDGDLIWVKELINSEYYQVANLVLDIQVDGHGDLILMGSVLQGCNFLGVLLTEGVYIAKVDSEANLKWVQNEEFSTWSTISGNFMGSRIAIDKDNNIVTYANQDGPSDIVKLFLVKYDPNGVKIWKKMILDTEGWLATSLGNITCDSAGNIIVSYGDGLATIAKYSSDGNLLWSLQGINALTSSMSHVIDKAGNIYYSCIIPPGAQIGKGANSYLNTSDFRSLLVKINSSGKILWVIPFQGSYEGFGSNLMIDQNGSIFLTCVYNSDFYFQPFRYNSQQTFQPLNAFILVLDSDGIFQSSIAGNILSPNQDDAVQTLQSVVDESGDIYTVGSFRGNLKFGCITTNSTGTASFYLVKHEHLKAIRDLKITAPSKLCNNSVITLETNSMAGISSYKWYLSDGATPVSGSSETVDSSIRINVIPKTGPQLFAVSINDNCTEYFSEPISIVVNTLPAPPEILSAKETICVGRTENFSVKKDDNIEKYIWTFPSDVSGIVSLNTDEAALTFSEKFIQGQINVIAQNYCGESSLAIPIKSYPSASKPKLSEMEIICHNVSDLLESIEPVPDAITYKWVLPDLISQNLDYPQNLITLHATISSQFEAGEIYIKAFGQCLDSTISDPLIIRRILTPESADLYGMENICKETTQLYHVSTITNASKYVWIVPNFFSPSGKIITTSTDLNLKTIFAGSGEIKVYGANECNERGDSSTVQVESFELLQPLLSKKNCENILTIENSIHPNWYKDGILIPDFHEVQLNFIDSGLYYVQVNNFCGIKQSASIKAYPIIENKMFIPNVITPNNDDKNEFFCIDKALKNSSIEIYNRWGKEIFVSRNYNNDWKSFDVDAGTYYYIIKNECLLSPIKGWISVLK
jgi:gliding motility-associated-like protein